MPRFAMSERYAPHDPAYLKEAVKALDELLGLVMPAARQLRASVERIRNTAKAVAG